METKPFDVACIPCRDYDPCAVEDAVRRAVEAAGGLSAIRPGMKVVIKANLVAAAAHDRATTTHPAVISAVAKLLTGRGARVVIGDSPGGLYTEGAVGRIYRSCGLESCVTEGVTLNHDFSEREADFPEAVIAHHFTYTGYLADADAIVNVCKLKSHGMMGLSAAAKNMFGTIPGTVKPEYHFRYPSYEAFANMLVDLDEYFCPVISVCDGIVAMEGNGPTAGTPRPVGVILASASPHRLDLLAAKLIGLTPDRVPTLLAAEKRGLVPAHVEDLSVYGEWKDCCVPDFKNVAVPHSLQFSGTSDNVLRNLFGKVAAKALTSKPKLKPSLCVGCNLCGRICPAGAITMKKGKAHIDRKACIRCFCCQEFCPKGAMKVCRPPVARFLDRNKK